MYVKKILLLIVLLSSLSIATLYAHSGRTDQQGGHNNRKTGGYHYHNAGSQHSASNHYQNHKTCGICASSKTKQKKTGKTILLTDKFTIMALQKGLKCMGYSISNIDGVLDMETKKAPKESINNKN